MDAQHTSVGLRSTRCTLRGVRPDLICGTRPTRATDVRSAGIAIARWQEARYFLRRSVSAEAFSFRHGCPCPKRHLAPGPPAGLGCAPLLTHSLLGYPSVVCCGCNFPLCLLCHNLPPPASQVGRRPSRGPCTASGRNEFHIAILQIPEPGTAPFRAQMSASTPVGGMTGGHTASRLKVIAIGSHFSNDHFLARMYLRTPCVRAPLIHRPS